jgi:hypothetical protein
MRRVLFLTTVLLCCIGAPAWADGPGVGTPAIVALGDSAISGEAGRWAGNTNNSSSRVDALGSTAYWDATGGEAIRGCHRSKAAEVHIGGAFKSANLACSGARTSTNAGGSDFKPGIDFYSDSSGRVGQALALQRYAAGNNVRAVTLLIGANNYGFADIVQACVTDWLTSPSWWPNYCNDDSGIRSRFTAARIATETANVTGAMLNVRQAMRTAGYADSQWTLLVQTYSSPIPRGSGFRYPQTGFTRQTIGGCGVWNRDADWANDTVVTTFNTTLRNAAASSGLTNAKIVDMTNALVGRRLCENTVGLLEERGIASWTSTGAVDQTEWVSQIRTVTAIFPPYQIQEDGHPSYWGQLALRNCLRQAFNGGTPRGGTCTIGGTGLVGGEPNMRFVSTG